MKLICKKMYSGILAAILIISLLSTFIVHAEGENTEPGPEPVAPGWHFEDNSFCFYVKEEGSIHKFTGTGVFQLQETTSHASANSMKVFKPGYYYFVAGQLKLSVSNVGQCLVYKVNADDTISQLGQYMVSHIYADKQTEGNVTTITPKTKLFTGMKNNTVYKDGLAYTGICKKNNVFYKVTNGVIGKTINGVLSTTYIDTAKNTLCQPTYKYYKNGVGYTGIANNTYYVNGTKSSFTGWKKSNKKIYYFKKGSAVTGTAYLPSYGGGSSKYRYSFYNNGILKTNLFKEGNPSVNYYKQRMKFELNLTTHTVTMLMYDSKTKTYDIPLKAFVCSTAKNGKGTKTGNHHLAKGSRCRWFVPPRATTHFYQWGVFIRGSYSWFHSEQFTSKNIRRFKASTYNGLGTNQTSACVRLQVVNAKLIYDIAGQNPYDIPVQIFRSSAKGAFGQITLADTTGKIPITLNHDPTDPLIK